MTVQCIPQCLDTANQYPHTVSPSGTRCLVYVVLMRYDGIKIRHVPFALPIKSPSVVYRKRVHVETSTHERFTSVQPRNALYSPLHLFRAERETLELLLFRSTLNNSDFGFADAVTKAGNLNLLILFISVVVFFCVTYDSRFVGSTLHPPRFFD